MGVAAETLEGIRNFAGTFDHHLIDTVNHQCRHRTVERPGMADDGIAPAHHLAAADRPAQPVQDHRAIPAVADVVFTRPHHLHPVPRANRLGGRRHVCGQIRPQLRVAQIDTATKTAAG
ncbi:hypothetical protein D3C75_1039750 [compost metagenome]